MPEKNQGRVASDFVATQSGNEDGRKGGRSKFITDGIVKLLHKRNMMIIRFPCQAPVGHQALPQWNMARVKWAVLPVTP